MREHPGALQFLWVADRIKELLPCAYFHVVFTVPHELVPLALANRELFYQALFRSTHETLKAVALNPANLGAKIGGLSVLHTWNQKLAFHPHLHCIVPSGGLLSVRRLSRVFRGKLLAVLEAALLAGKLRGDPAKMHRGLRKAAGKDFVVYAKAPFGGPAQVLKYLGRYTHRVGICEQRILSVKDGQVSFVWADRSDGGSRHTMTLPLAEFVRKFLLHLLPRGLRKIRYFGYMANPPPAISTLAATSPETPEPPDTVKEIKILCRLCGAKMLFEPQIPLDLPRPAPELESTG